MGIGDWAQSPIPKPQNPKPQNQNPKPQIIKKKKNKKNNL